MRSTSTCATAAIVGVLALAPAARSQTPGSFTLVGHEPLMNRGMNAALAIHGDYAYVGSRTDGKDNNANNAGVMIVDIKDPAHPTIARQIGPPLEGIPRESSRELRVWHSQEIVIVLHTNCGGATAHLCAQPSSNNFRFYDISGERAADPRLILQLNRDAHEFFLWEDPSNARRALLFAGGAGRRGRSTTCRRCSKGRRRRSCSTAATTTAEVCIRSWSATTARERTSPCSPQASRSPTSRTPRPAGRTRSTA
jgi:hypothetical protein